jgi:phosphatidylinositol kinase/protein kinase (PI-3  family)
VLNWYHSQVNSSVLPNNETLIANVNSNVNPLIDRIRTLIPENMNTVKLFELSTSANYRITELIERAVNPEKLSQIDPTWHPWL